MSSANIELEPDGREDEARVQLSSSASPLVVAATVEPPLPPRLGKHHLGLPTGVRELHAPILGVGQASVTTTVVYAVLGVAVFAAIYCNWVILN